MEGKKFTYTYSAAENEEIKRIREKYIQPSPYDGSKRIKLNQLKKLDGKVANIATFFSITTGIIGVLIFGLGMSCVTVWNDKYFAEGIFIGIAGILSIAAAYPVNQFVLAKMRKKYASKIIQLSDELLNQ